MKKFSLFSILLLSFLLVWCANNSNVDSDISTEEVSDLQENSDSIVLDNNEIKMCQSAVKSYLDQADFKWKWSKKVKKWSNIAVHYIWRLNDSEVFDTSVEDVAKACDKYHPSRDYEKWLSFTVWAGQMIAGFDKWVEWMKVWQSKTITIPAKEAYGEWSKENIVELDRTQVPGDFKKWDQLMSEMWQTFVVYDIDEKTITLDANHELAGKDLIFDITIISID